MADASVQRVREWLRSQPFSLRLLTLILFVEEAVEEEFGTDAMNAFDAHFKAAFLTIPEFAERFKADPSKPM